MLETLTTQEPPPSIEKLKPGVYGYFLDLTQIDDGVNPLLDAYNKALELITQQGGTLIGGPVPITRYKQVGLGQEAESGFLLTVDAPRGVQKA